MRRTLGCLLLACAPSLAVTSLAATTTLSDLERVDVETRLERFYAAPADAGAMHVVPPKFDVAAGRFVHDNEELRLPPGETPSEPLLAAAQRKGTEEFRRIYCDKVLKKKFPEMNCDAEESDLLDASIEANDRVERLAYTWIAPDRLLKTLEGVPSTGESALPLWSDDYWPTRYGQTSFRYAKGTYYGSYKAAVAAYAQPAEWTPLAKSLGIAELSKRIVPWSPSEKYDLSLGDEAFTLTNAQKQEGRRYLNAKEDVEEWMGLCHGWSAASVMVAPPKKPVKLAGPKGVPVEWYPGDVKAMLTLAWSNGNSYNNFVGGRCNVRKATTYPNGRLKDQECFDTNPATFHMALGNLVGLAQHTFIFDTSFDYEVWNQPVKGYRFEYFNPLDRSKRSAEWRDVAVDYDARFKAADRFQKPPTRGLRTASGWNDAGIKKVVGVIATVSYIVEVRPPPHQAEDPEAAVTRVTYTYDLELHDEGGALVPKGGEWHENAHPDFLWIPKAHTVARTALDYVDLKFTGKSAPAADVTETARAASVYGYPLCQPLKRLLAEGTGKDSYRCPEPR